YTICILPIYFAIFSLFKKPLKDKNFEIREMQNKYYSTMNEQFTYMYNIKINSEYGNENKKMTSFFSRYIKSFKGYIGLILIFNLSQNSIALIFQIITIIIGIYFIIKKQMTVGSLVVVSSYFNITENTIKYYYNLAGDYITFKVADKRNDELLNFEEERNGEKLISEVYNLQGNITYGYDKKLFKDLKIDLQLSDILYIIGENGCGKTTLIQILNGIINDKNILLKINGVNYIDIDMLDLRKNNISNVPQKIYMLDGKVRDYLKNTDIKEDFI
ncbi:ATP-binding cassette domain-containing protein, partial [Sneathia sp. DSM 16630]|nr:ATP-binding cassette domain-containing protein [Sneathia sp. DSM 16630]